VKKLIIIFFLFSFQNVLIGAESKIVYKIENEIITNIDIKREYRYLITLNTNLKNINKERVLKIASESIIKEKIKKIEVLRNFKNLDVKESYVELLIEKIYTDLQISSKKEFIEYMSQNGLKLEDIRGKLKIDSLWNELIVKKFSPQVNIDIERIKRELNLDNKKIVKSFLLSEIYFNIDNKDEINQKYLKIKESIEDVGFKNSASIYSVSDTAKTGGAIGWVNETSINAQIKSKIINLKKGNFSGPIIMPGGILILKIKDIKEEKNKLNMQQEISKKINYERNRQLNQFSKIYFNKIKKRININEN